MSAKVSPGAYFQWLQLVGSLASIVANRGGAAPTEIQYLNLLVGGVRHGTLTDEQITILQKRVENEIRTGVAPASEDLLALEDRLIRRSEQIQDRDSSIVRDETVDERRVREQQEAAAQQREADKEPHNHPDNGPAVAQ